MSGVNDLQSFVQYPVTMFDVSTSSSYTPEGIITAATEAWKTLRDDNGTKTRKLPTLLAQVGKRSSEGSNAEQWEICIDQDPRVRVLEEDGTFKDYAKNLEKRLKKDDPKATARHSGHSALDRATYEAFGGQVTKPF